MSDPNRNPDGTPRDRGKSAARSGGAVQGQQVFGVGLTLAVSVGLFAYGGLWLDRKLGTKPWLLLLMVLCGIVGGILHTIRVLAPQMWPFGKPAEKTGSDERSDEESSPPTG
ncbi:MAG: AtpZ/AtpI family protein [Planctomycetes bacterium]|nr:AtpZ/AtpI family protein [Planctomycetota bacterium]